MNETCLTSLSDFLNSFNTRLTTSNLSLKLKKILCLIANSSHEDLTELCKSNYNSSHKKIFFQLISFFSLVHYEECSVEEFFSIKRNIFFINLVRGSYKSPHFKNFYALMRIMGIFGTSFPIKLGNRTSKIYTGVLSKFLSNTASAKNFKVYRLFYQISVILTIISGSKKITLKIFCEAKETI